MKLYIFTSRKDATERKINFCWSKARLITEAVDLAIQKFDEYVLEGNNVYMVCKTKKDSGRTMYDNDDMNYFIIAMSLKCEGYLFEQSVVKDYVIMHSRYKEVEFCNNLKVLEQMNYCTLNRIPAEFKIIFVDNDDREVKTLFDTADYFMHNIPEGSNKFILNLSKYETESLPRKFYKVNLKEEKEEKVTNRPTVVAQN